MTFVLKSLGRTAADLVVLVFDEAGRRKERAVEPWSVSFSSFNDSDNKPMASSKSSITGDFSVGRGHSTDFLGL